MSNWHVRRCANRIGVRVYLPRWQAVFDLNDVPRSLLDNREPMVLLTSQ